VGNVAPHHVDRSARHEPPAQDEGIDAFGFVSPRDFDGIADVQAGTKSVTQIHLDEDGERRAHGPSNPPDDVDRESQSILEGTSPAIVSPVRVR